MVPGTESVDILDLDALIKMPIPEVNPEEEVEKELYWQATMQMRAYRWEKDIEVESETKMYEDLEPVLIQKVGIEVEKEKEVENVNMVGLSSTTAFWTLVIYIFCIFLIALYITEAL